MDTNPTDGTRLYPINVDEYGRMVIPADTKIRQACKNGEKLVAVEDALGELKIRRYRDIVSEIQEKFASVLPAGKSMVDELIAERRAEAARE